MIRWETLWNLMGTHGFGETWKHEIWWAKHWNLWPHIVLEQMVLHHVLCTLEVDVHSAWSHHPEILLQGSNLKGPVIGCWMDHNRAKAVPDTTWFLGFWGFSTIMHPWVLGCLVCSPILYFEDYPTDLLYVYPHLVKDYPTDLLYVYPHLVFWRLFPPTYYMCIPILYFEDYPTNLLYVYPIVSPSCILKIIPYPI